VTNALKRPLSFTFVASLLALVALPIIGGATAAGASTAAITAHDVSFPATTVGDILGPEPIHFVNTGANPVTGFTIGGADPDDFTEVDTCAFPLVTNATCDIDVYFVPGELGPRTGTVIPLTASSEDPPVANLSGTGTEGYYETTTTGLVSAHGDAVQLGDTSGLRLTQPIVASATVGDDAGYWLAAADGGIFTFGDAGYFGSTGAIHLNKPIVGMAATVDALGYWLVATDGGIFSFGDAPFFGSTGNIHLNKPIVGMAATPDDEGYWLVASDGGIFSFGDASFFGSTGAIHLNQPIVGMASTPDGGGYWLVASDGGIFSFGDAQFYGSTGAITLNKPIVAMAATPDGAGYWLMASDGGIFTFGDAPFDGSSAGPSTSGYVSIATDAPPTVQAILDVPGARHFSIATPSGAPSPTRQARRG
jgi:hypothetical protein